MIHRPLARTSLAYLRFLNLLLHQHIYESKFMTTP